MKRGMNVGCGLTALLVVCVVGVACFGWDRFQAEPRRRFQRLLRGDARVEVASLIVTGQERRIELTDPESVRYLTVAFRSAVKEGHVPTHNGFSYYAEVQLGSVGFALIGFDAADDEDGVTVAFPIEEFGDPTYYWVPFPEPRPAQVSAALDLMRKR
jgi:hypothetical protein